MGYFKSPTSKLANKFLSGLKGIEMGASAHNPFGLDTINVDFTDRTDTSWVKEQIENCGEAAKVDVVADGTKLPFYDGQWDFVVSSHCLEHNWDTLGALKEWIRVVKPGGFVFTIFPNPEKTFDKGRPRTKLTELIARHNGSWPRPNMEGLVATIHTWVLFHHTVWDLVDALECASYIGGTEMVYAIAEDDKVGNGFVFVLKKL